VLLLPGSTKGAQYEKHMNSASYAMLYPGGWDPRAARSRSQSGVIKIRISFYN
jgi:hypothetical protein